MSIAFEVPTVDDRDLIDDLVEVRFGGPMVDAWLKTMWGIQPGKSSPVCQLTTAGLAPDIASWLHHLWAFSPAPDAGRSASRWKRQVVGKRRISPDDVPTQMPELSAATTPETDDRCSTTPVS
jgi:hypothetical protein